MADRDVGAPPGAAPGSFERTTVPALIYLSRKKAHLSPDNRSWWTKTVVAAWSRDRCEPSTRECITIASRPGRSTFWCEPLQMGEQEFGATCAYADAGV